MTHRPDTDANFLGDEFAVFGERRERGEAQEARLPEPWKR